MLALATLLIAYLQAAPSIPATKPAVQALESPAWLSWWERNRACFATPGVVLGCGVPEVGSDGWFLGHDREPELERLKVAPQDVTKLIALLEEVRASEREPRVEGQILRALAKIGEDFGKPSTLAPELITLLGRAELRDDALIALGTLADAAAIHALVELLEDSQRGRALVGAQVIDSHTRALAAYALARVGWQSSVADGREEIVRAILSLLSSAHIDAELELACIQALGLVALERVEPTAEHIGAREVFELLLARLADGSRAPSLRAQAALALARSLAEFPNAYAAPWRKPVSAALLARLADAATPLAVRRQTALALGVVGNKTEDRSLRRRIAAELRTLPTCAPDQILGGAALLAIGALGAAGADPNEAAEDSADLIAALDCDEPLRPWAALACGRMGWELAKDPWRRARLADTLATLRKAIRAHLALPGDQRTPFVIATGLLADGESVPSLIESLAGAGGDALGCELATALGSAGVTSRVDAQSALRSAMARLADAPRFCLRAGEARVRLDDPELVPELLAGVPAAHTAAELDRLVIPLTTTSERRVLAPLTALLRDPQRPPELRARAAWALGELANKEYLPWTALFTRDLDLIDAPPTLIDPTSGRGLLDQR